MPISFASAWPINTSGQIILDSSGTDITPVGYLSEDTIPITTLGGVACVGVAPTTTTTTVFHSATTTAIPTSTTVFKWNAEIYDTPNVYNPATGDFDLLKAGTYSFDMFFYSTSLLVAPDVYVWAQTSTDGGTVWNDIETSGRVFTAGGLTPSMASLSGSLYVATPLKIRIVHKATNANGNFVKVSIPSVATAYVPASKASLTYLG